MFPNTKPTSRDLFVFGVVLPLAVAAAGALVRLRFGSSEAGTVVWALGGAVWVAYALVAPVRRPIFIGLQYAAYPLMAVVTYVILACVWALAVLPVGVVMRATRRDPLERSFDPRASSYFAPHMSARRVDRYLDPF